MLKKLYFLILCIMALFAFQSCTAISYSIKYHVNDNPVFVNNSGVEEPILISIGESLPTYQDELIDILWIMDRDELHFRLTNMSDKAIKIIWDECTFYESRDNTACRIIHSGISVPDAFFNKISQIPTVVPGNGANHIDFILPTSHVKVDSDDYEVNIKPIFYRKVKKSRLKKYINNHRNYVYTIHLPIIANDIKYDYKFELIIDSVVPKQ